MASRRNTHRDVASVPNRTDGIEHLEQEARAVLQRAAVYIRTVIRAVLQKLVRQITIGSVQFDTIEAGLFRKRRSATEFFDHAGNFFEREGARRYLFNLDDLAIFVVDCRVFIGTHGGRRDRHFSTDVGRVRLSSRTPFRDGLTNRQALRCSGADRARG